jgi:hypothetical protein
MSARRFARWAFPAWVAASTLAGCASPGAPTPRQRPIIPQAVTDLSALQQGNEVVLSFTLPARSTRDQPLGEAPAIEIYRGAVEPGGKPAAKARTQLIYTIPGNLANSYEAGVKIVYRDRILPEELASAAAGRAESVYLVRTREDAFRASAESNRVALVIYPPPQPVPDVHAELIQPSATGASPAVSLSWPREANGAYAVYRAEITAQSAPAAATDASKAVLETPLAKIAEVHMPENATGAPLFYRDATVGLGRSYLYIVRRVAQFGAKIVESADSQAVLITVTEVTAPAAPQGVIAVVVPATAQAPAYVSLSWAITSEAGVAGYDVYRSEQADTRGSTLNESLVGSPTYKDTAVAAGGHYYYRVVAVDGAGRESAPSEAVEAQIPGP